MSLVECGINRADVVQTQQINLGVPLLGLENATTLAQQGYLLREGRTPLATRITICQNLVYLGRIQDALFHDCVAILHSVLSKSLINPPLLNSHVIEALINLGAIESVPEIARAFATCRVDQSITGSWPLVQAKLGLVPYTAIQTQRSTPAAVPLSQPRRWRAGDGFAPPRPPMKRQRQHRHAGRL